MSKLQTSLFELETSQLYCEVIVELNARSLDRALTYSLPDELQDSIQVGSYVSVPLMRQTVAGYVVALTNEKPVFKTKPIIEKLLDENPLSATDIELARWIADRYRSGLLAALRCFLPPGGARKPERRLYLTEVGASPGAESSVTGAPQQQVALNALRQQDDIEINVLAKCFGGGKEGVRKATSAIRALVDKGLVTERRRLRRPSAGPRTQQFACLCDDSRDWVLQVDELQTRAPRQAEAISLLLEAEGEPVLVSELPREAIGALQKQGLVEIFQQRIERLPDVRSIQDEAEKSLNLSPHQQVALERILQATAKHEVDTFLLHGVTGSGKTEVYLQAIDAVIRDGRSAILLVPEISLTPQAVGRLRARFGSRLALLHSALGVGERFDQWERIRRGEADIVVGARSAIFAPCPNLGLIIIDEEHEHAYKQDAEPRYLAHVIASQRAQMSGAVLVLGSATPSVESFYSAMQSAEKVNLLELPERIDNRPMPLVELIDLRNEPRSNTDSYFSLPLLEGLKECVERGEQAIIFLNRRGFSTFVMCRDCGVSLRCPDCAVSLTYHHKTRRLRCHHCDYDRAVPDLCEECEGSDIGFHGMGTERVADQIARLVEGAVVARMDRDTTTQKGAHANILRAFAAGDANVLVGTQMIAKGHDFPNVTLVGVLNADTGLNRPDFRAAEHTFQILTQVSGRAGRADKPGKVLVQTFNPDHYAIAAAAEHDFGAFYLRELASRQDNLYPPFVKLLKLGFSDEDEEQALAVAQRVSVLLEQRNVKFKQGEIQYVGPAEAPLHKLRGQFRYHTLLKGPSRRKLCTLADELLAALGETGNTLVTVDVDPVDMM